MLTYAGIMVLHVQQIPAAWAVIATPCILTATVRALASCFLFAFINVWKMNSTPYHKIKKTLFKKQHKQARCETVNSLRKVHCQMSYSLTDRNSKHVKLSLSISSMTKTIQFWRTSRRIVNCKLLRSQEKKPEKTWDRTQKTLISSFAGTLISRVLQT